MSSNDEGQAKRFDQFCSSLEVFRLCPTRWTSALWYDGTLYTVVVVSCKHWDLIDFGYSKQALTAWLE